MVSEFLKGVGDIRIPIDLDIPREMDAVVLGDIIIITLYADFK
jgi:hypothetical protein